MRKCAKVQPVPFHLLLLGVTAIKGKEREKKKKEGKQKKKRTQRTHARAHKNNRDRLRDVCRCRTSGGLRPSLAANADDSNGVYFACAFEMQRIFSKIEPLLSEQNIGVFQKIINPNKKTDTHPMNRFR